MDVPNSNNTEATSEPPSFDPATMIALLQMLHKTAPPQATYEANIADIMIVSAEQTNEAFVRAKKVLQSKIPYDVERNYDCAHLRDTVLRKIVAAKEKGDAAIVLENRCCSKKDCPQIMFMQIFLDELRGTSVVVEAMPLINVDEKDDEKDSEEER